MRFLLERRMPIEIFESFIPATPPELFDWHASQGAFERLCPPWQSIEIQEPAPVENGSRVELRITKGPLRLPWTAEHTGVTAGREFADVQVAGPLARWVHHHEFEAAGAGSVLRDRIDYALPGGTIGRVLAGDHVRRDLSTTFAYRHETTARDLARHASFAGRSRLRVAVTGSGGLVGASLAPFLSAGGHRILRLRPGLADEASPTAWHPTLGLASPEEIAPFDALVHLAGEPIADGRWTAALKQRILASRVDGTRNLVRSLGRMPSPPRALVCASAIGYYGSRGSERLDEQSAPGEGFLAEVSRAWEAAASEAAELGIRVVMLRFGVILTPAGGALAEMLPPFKLGAGGRIGDGEQYWSWVSIDDVIGAVHRALLDERLSGPVNVTAPNPVTNREFTETLGRALHRPTLVPVPALGARVVLGEMADEMLLASARVLPRKLEEVGFGFDDAELGPALDRLLGRSEMT